MITAFQLVIDQIPTGNELGDVLASFNPIEIYRRIRAEKYPPTPISVPSRLIHVRALDHEIASIVRSRQQSAKSTIEKTDYRPVLDLALQDIDYGSHATLPELVDQMKTFLFAGHDTSASMLSWSYYYLSFHPSCHAKLVREHDHVFGVDTDPRVVADKIRRNPTLLSRMEYTLAVLKESLRLRPIGDGVRYAPLEGYVIRTGTGAEFDASGTILNAQHGGLHTREESWGLRAGEFDPERFMGGRHVPIGYMPFATRPRDCIGRNLAYIEVIISCVGAYCRGRLRWR